MALINEHIRKPNSEDYEEIVAGTKSFEVFTVSIDNSSWTAVTLPSTQKCESALIKCRNSDNVFMISHLSGGSPYFTFEAGGTFTLDIDKDASAVLCYVKGTEASDTLEVIISA